MRKIKEEQLEELIEAHKPVRFRDSDVQRASELSGFKYALDSIYLRDMKKAWPKLREVFSKYAHLGFKGMDAEMPKEDIQEFKDNLRMIVPVEYDSIVAKYSGIDEASIGGYVSKEWGKLSLDVRKLFVMKAAGTKMKIIESNGYRSHDQTNFMIEEIIRNAEEHGNQRDENKDVYLLWHKCGDGKEVYIIDEGEQEFDFDKEAKRRADLGMNHSGCELSGTNLLRANSKSFEYFSVVDNEGKKKGTVLKIVLSEEKEPCGNCDYVGKEIFEPSTS